MTGAIGRRPTDGRSPGHRATLVALAGSTALGAWFGAYGLVSGWLSLGAEIEGRLPFASPVLGGAALALLVAVPMTVTTVWAALGDPRQDAAALVAGVLQMGWIVVQLGFIRSLSIFHPLYFGVGLLVAWLGRFSLGERWLSGSRSVRS